MLQDTLSNATYRQKPLKTAKPRHLASDGTCTTQEVTELVGSLKPWASFWTVLPDHLCSHKAKQDKTGVYPNLRYRS